MVAIPPSTLSRIHDPVRQAFARPEVRRKLKRRIGRFYRDRQDVEEVLQEVAVRALVKATSAGPASCVEGWLLALATRHCLNRRRDRARRRDLDDRVLDLLEWLDPVSPGRIDEQVWGAEMLGSLAPEQREIVVQVVLEGQSHADVADSLGVSRRTVGNRLASALATLRRRVEVDGVGSVHEEPVLDVA
ncbi:MAG: RNA polymerase sigma factor [Myxococcales bacterium]|nr:RNA polymerase sigma factor [Myxococcales bacterium]MCB9672041.1 RNA polymerase sigma factor [Alphaproteobacteria bacterium]